MMLLSREPHVLAMRSATRSAGAPWRTRVAQFRAIPYFYSLVSLIAPVIIFVIGIWAVNKAIDHKYIIMLSGPQMADKFEGAFDKVISPITDFGGRFRYVRPQYLLF